MGKLSTKAIRTRARQLLASRPRGMRFAELARMIAQESPETPSTTINTQIADWPKLEPDVVYRPERGIFRLVEFATSNGPPKNGGGSSNVHPHLEPTVSTLSRFGFVHVGSGAVTGDDLRLTLHRHSDRFPCLYAFVIDGQVVYLGKSRRALRARLAGYEKFGPSQITNRRIHERIRTEIANGKGVEVYAMIDWEAVEYRGLTVDLAAGIEDALIDRMTPPWNGAARDDSPA